MSNFKRFAEAVRKQFGVMSQGPLFQSAAAGDEVWSKYLASFPVGSDPLFKKKTEHDCSCCRHFIRSVGNVVAVQNGALTTVWDLTALPEPYQTVADAMSAYVKSFPIADAFFTKMPKYGVEESKSFVGDVLLRFNHFSVEVPRACVTRDADAARGEVRAKRDVLDRGLREISASAVETVLDLIQQESLYRGAEHRHAVENFLRLKQRYDSADERGKSLFAWQECDGPASRFRNTVIGTLAQDLSDGVDLEKAVKSFESKVAPLNYKRPKALITASMVKDATKTISELGLESALKRRHARLSDVSVDSVLFVDNSVRGEMKGGIADLLMEEVKPKPFDAERAERVTISEFTERVLPQALSLELFVDNGLIKNFVSVTAPAEAGASRLFKWKNDFAWSYEGNAADSIKDRVKTAGGMVEGVKLRVSLAWNNHDDLDLHVVDPNGNRTFYANRNPGVNCGVLDVDMNAGRGTTRTPVENVRWVKEPHDGDIKVYVDQYCRRESTAVGFTLEIEHDGVVDTLVSESSPTGEKLCCTLRVERGRVKSVTPAKGLTATTASRDHWGLKTMAPARVDSVVLSPNHWDGEGVGSRHWFFILKGCKNPLPTRGIYNEFLRPELEKHRRVFEVLGDKTKCPVAEEQLSGVGFTAGRGDRVLVSVTGRQANRVYEVTF